VTVGITYLVSFQDDGFNISKVHHVELWRRVRGLKWWMCHGDSADANMIKVVRSARMKKGCTKEERRLHPRCFDADHATHKLLCAVLAVVSDDLCSIVNVGCDLAEKKKVRYAFTAAAVL